MVHTLTVLTLDLATAIGLYWIAAAIGLMLAPQRLGAMMEDMARLPTLAFVMGLAAFAIGTAMLIAHHVLYDPLGTIVTLLAGALAIEGLALIAVPRALLALARPFAAAPRLWAIVSLVAGAAMLLAGLTGRANALP